MRCWLENVPNSAQLRVEDMATHPLRLAGQVHSVIHAPGIRDRQASVTEILSTATPRLHIEVRVTDRIWLIRETSGKPLNLSLLWIFYKLHGHLAHEAPALKAYVKPFNLPATLAGRMPALRSMRTLPMKPRRRECLVKPLVFLSNSHSPTSILFLPFI